MGLDLADTLSFAEVSLPGWLALVDEGDGAATLLASPDEIHFGIYIVSIVVNDSRGGSAT